jgi:hydroxyacylglutathione hydrolase
MTDATMTDPANPPLKGAIVPVTPFQQNSTVLWCTATMKGAVTDPGGEIDRILAAAEQHGVTVEKILVTHGHLDHASGVADLRDRLGVPVEGPHEDDKFWIDQLDEQGRMFGIAGGRPFTPDRWLHEGDQVSFGEITMDVHHCPGHTPGHVIFHHPASHFAVVGDVLFQGSIGRTDFPRGNHDELIRSIRERLWPLGDDTVFIPGHGPASTFGQERKTNPFVADHLFA